MATSFLVLNTLNTFLLTKKGMKEFILSKALHDQFEFYHKKQKHLSLQNLKKSDKKACINFAKLKQLLKTNLQKYPAVAYKIQ